MTSGSPAQRDIWQLRVLLFLLAVVAQMGLPGMVLRAQAFQSAVCSAQDASAQKQRPQRHDHAQQCAHCRSHDCLHLAPRLRVDLMPRAGAAESPQPQEVVVGISRQVGAYPPPTGPPVAASSDASSRPWA